MFGCSDLRDLLGSSSLSSGMIVVVLSICKIIVDFWGAVRSLLTVRNLSWQSGTGLPLTETEVLSSTLSVNSSSYRFLN